MHQKVMAAHSHCTNHIALPTECHNGRLVRATIRGATANSTNKAISTPASTTALASRARADQRPAPTAEAASSAIPSSVDTITWTLNNRAAMLPARAFSGRCMNSSGTTPKPSVVRLPHHRAETHSGQARSASDVLNRDNFVMPGSTGRQHFRAVPDYLADQRTGDRAADVDQALLEIGLVLTHDLVFDLLS